MANSMADPLDNLLGPISEGEVSKGGKWVGGGGGGTGPNASPQFLTLCQYLIVAKKLQLISGV